MSTADPETQQVISHLRSALHRAVTLLKSMRPQDQPDFFDMAGNRVPRPGSGVNEPLMNDVIAAGEQALDRSRRKQKP